MREHIITVRDAAPDDVAEMTGLLRELFAIEKDFSFDEDRQRRGLMLMLDGCAKHRTVKVAVTDGIDGADGRIIGMATAQTLISTAEGGIAAVMEDVIVKDGFRGQGIGTRLVASIRQWAELRGATRLQLLADRENRGGMAFYTRVGWRPTQLTCMRCKI